MNNYTEITLAQLRANTEPMILVLMYTPDANLDKFLKFMETTNFVNKVPVVAKYMCNLNENYDVVTAFSIREVPVIYGFGDNKHYPSLITTLNLMRV